MGQFPMDAIVLAGGKGTRLQRIVGDRPKPMAQVAGRPFVEWLLLALRSQGLRRVILSTGYKGDMVEAHFGDGERLGLDLIYSHESVPLGTGGAVRHALRKVETDRALVLNGDSFCQFSVNQLASVHLQTRAQATLWLVQMDDCRRYGAVEIERNGNVVAFREKSLDQHAGLINAGVYLIDRHVLAAIPADRPVSLETDVFPTLIGRGLHATSGKGVFLDIGTPESYRLADSFIARNTALWHAAT
jgi:NDP-sugar pyrophosphorylase family protein